MAKQSEHSTAEHAKSSLATYFAIWIALLVGTGLTVYASGVNLGRFNAAVALSIATIKATLVAFFFMHIKGASERLTKVVVISALFFLLLLLGLTTTDYATRLWS
jgi:cytochrome c oxidase subunit IV